MTVEELVDLTATVGLRLQFVDGEASLYAWVTPQREVLYVGKSVSPARVQNEHRFATADPTAETVSGFIALVRRNRASCQRLRVHGFDPAPARQLIAGGEWGGHAIDVLTSWLDRVEDDPAVMTTELAEKFIIRTLVRCGVPVGNSRDASQWETPIGDPMDTLAVLVSIPVLGPPVPEEMDR